nr:hypothetical protein CFP56_03616 [Quercus suber]
MVRNFPYTDDYALLMMRKSLYNNECLSFAEMATRQSKDKYAHKVVDPLPSSAIAPPVTRSKGKGKVWKSVWEDQATVIGRAHNVITDEELRGLSAVPSHKFVSHYIHKLIQAKGGTISGLLSEKKTGDVSKKDSVTTIPNAHSPAKHPISPTLSMEMIASGGEEIKKKKKASGKSFLPTFWDDADAATLKAHEVLSMDDLSSLMVKSSGEVMLSHIQKLVQVPTSKPLVKSLFDENEMLKNKVAILTVEVENDKERLVEGFDLLVKWMAKFHPGLDLSGLAVVDVEKELLSAEATAENVMKEATDVTEGMKEATVITPTDIVPDEQ